MRYQHIHADFPQGGGTEMCADPSFNPMEGVGEMCLPDTFPALCVRQAAIDTSPHGPIVPVAGDTTGVHLVESFTVQ